jgi:hypothetical protein
MIGLIGRYYMLTNTGLFGGVFGLSKIEGTFPSFEAFLCRPSCGCGMAGFRAGTDLDIEERGRECCVISINCSGRPSV